GRRVAGPEGHLQDPGRGSGPTHRGPARAGSHARACGSGSRGRAQGGAPVADGALYRGAPPGVTRSARPGRPPHGSMGPEGVCARRTPTGLGPQSLPVMPPQPRVSTLADARERAGASTAPRIESSRPISLGKLSPVEAEAAGKRLAYFLPAQRTSALAHGGVAGPRCAPLHLGKEPTPCL